MLPESPNFKFFRAKVKIFTPSPLFAGEGCSSYKCRQSVIIFLILDVSIRIPTAVRQITGSEGFKYQAIDGQGVLIHTLFAAGCNGHWVATHLKPLQWFLIHSAQ